MDVIEQIRLDLRLAQRLASGKIGETIEGYEIVSIDPIGLSKNVTLYELIVHKEGKILKSLFSTSFMGKDPEHTPYRKEEPIFVKIN